MYIDTRFSSEMSEIEHYLKPMARQCINSRLDYRQISEIFNTVLVSIAESEFTIAGKSQTDSRISLLTGVHRKDVRRLLSQVQNKTLFSNIRKKFKVSTRQQAIVKAMQLGLIFPENY